MKRTNQTGLAIVALLAFLTLPLTGCGRGPGGAGGGAGSKVRIGAVLPMFSHPFFLAQKRGLEEKAKELGAGDRRPRRPG